MIETVPYAPDQAASLVGLWNAASGGRFPIMPELWAANTAGDPSFRADELRVALVDGAPAGFAIAKRFRGEDADCARYHDVGYVALMAVAPAYQGRGIGTILLRGAEAILRQAGARRVVLGGSFHHFMPGVPVWSDGAPAPHPADASRGAAPTERPGALGFFVSRGYEASKDVYDVRRRLEGPFTAPGGDPALAEVPDAALRPFRPGEAAALLAFLARAFPGRWRRDVAHFLASGGDIQDVMGLFVAGAPQGFAHLHPPGSVGALRWAGFDPDVAALGPIGVASEWHGRGLGLALLKAGVAALRARGARDLVIDWTDLLAFYAKAGFAPWLRYTLASKELA